MKAKLLRKLRSKGGNVIEVLSVTTTSSAFNEDTVTGMSYSFTGDEYSDLFHYGCTEKDVKEKACKIWLNLNIERIRIKYRKYTRKFHQLN